MKDTPKHERKIAKTRPKTNQNNPLMQHRRYANLSRAELHDVICRNVNKPHKQHQQCAALSKMESRNLIGQNINKGDSSRASVSQKRKHKHAVKRGRHLLKLKTLKTSTKLQITEVSHKRQSLKRLYILRHRYLKSIGHEISHERDPHKINQSRLLKPSKVRKLKTVTGPKVSKSRKCLKRLALSGNKMSRRNDKDMSENSDEERERRKNQPKNLKQKPKSSKSWQVKRGDIDPVAFSHQIELAFTAIKNRQSNKPLKPEEVQKHLNAIGVSVRNKRAPRRPKKNSSKALPSAGPEVRESVVPKGKAPEGTTNHGTGRAPKIQNKRKRSEIKVKSEPDSDSSEPLRIPKKR